MYFSACIKSDDEEDEVRIIVLYCTLNCRAVPVSKNKQKKHVENNYPFLE